MRKLVIYTYFLVQFFTVSFGLIQIELARTGAAEMQPILWLLQLLKSIMVVVFAMGTESNHKLPLKIYFPQMILDIVYMTSTSNKGSWLMVCLGYALLFVAAYNWEAPKRLYSRLFTHTASPSKIDFLNRHVHFFGMRRLFPTSTIRDTHRSLI